MALSIEELQQSTRIYIGTKIKIWVTEFRPDVPPKLNRNEGFSFNISVENQGTIVLVNLRFSIRVANPTIAKLIVPRACL
jgi:hypothetical protein